MITIHKRLQNQNNSQNHYNNNDGFQNPLAIINSKFNFIEKLVKTHYNVTNKET